MTNESNMINNSNLNEGGTEIKAAVVVGSGSNLNVGLGEPFKEFAYRLIATIANAEIAMGTTPTTKSVVEHIDNIEPLFCAYAEFCLNKAFGTGWRADLDATKDEISTKPQNFRDRDDHTYALYTFLGTGVQADQVISSLLAIIAYDQSYLEKMTSAILVKPYDLLIERLNLVVE
ncbi:MAG: hypothetical protein HRT95_03780 [Moritella sp.]|uniref:hypothetical protein n=1 Tax=Moritella sp. TaxID=78556 RepID=UPI001D88B188|nr:hypothetical protein [Moritella sp.]NQZ49325.1 hypothetical protein [Moritella sp.]